jgi:penicillin-binding protein 1C
MTLLRQNTGRFLKNHRSWAGAMAIFVFGVAYYFCLPEPLFTNGYSTVLNDRHNNLLGAVISDDGQWRFPPVDSVPGKYKIALLQFEDRHFYRHPGVNPGSMARAAYQNIKSGKVVSGGSSISMQVIRLSRKGKPRDYLEKLIEMVLATRLELRYTKEEILNIYASHAPFGGNIVGITAASWRYFGRNPYELSWGEACLLAVLPNSPALIHPGRNRDQLIMKRNRLINRLAEADIIDRMTAELARSEAVPEKPERLPEIARHLLFRAIKEGKKSRVIESTLDINVQRQVFRVVNLHHDRLKANEINNVAAIVVEVGSGNVLAYVGNVNAEDNEQAGGFVDIIMSRRSTGSIMKPFLYAAMLDEGFILPHALVPDTPTMLDGFAPKNFTQSFDGAVPASRALARSLNVPAVHMLRDYGFEKFYHKMKDFGLTTLDKPPSHYGLSLILGGAEASLWDLTGAYAGMARTLNQYFKYPEPNRYNKDDLHPPNYLLHNEKSKNIQLSDHGIVDAGALWHTINALLDVNRPNEESSWRLFSSSQKIAWKTGTSYGFRDAWAIGLTPEYVVGVWAGNASGEGRPGLIGTEAAAPVLFDIFSFLPQRLPWFSTPYSDLVHRRVCRASGMLASDLCDDVDTLWICKKGTASGICTYHRAVFLDRTEQFRVDSDCEQVGQMIRRSWFVLPPAMEWYFKSKNASYKPLPPVRSDCHGAVAKVASMELIYPQRHSRIFVPRELDGSLGRSVFEIAHRSAMAEVYWHLNDQYIGTTKRIHQMGINPEEGNHTLTWVDDNGESLKVTFDVIGR